MPAVSGAYQFRTDLGIYQGLQLCFLCAGVSNYSNFNAAVGSAVEFKTLHNKSSFKFITATGGYYSFGGKTVV